MNKRTKISLILVITVVLVTLGVGLASARQINTPACLLEWQAMNRDGEPAPLVITGEAEWDLDGSILTLTCTGNIPFGETVGKSWFILYNLDQMRDYIYETYGVEVGDPFVIGLDETRVFWLIRVDQGDIIPPYEFSLLVESNGDFEYQAYFELE